MPILPVSQLTPETIDPLWPGWLARGHLHLLDGDPGMGKSLTLIDLAARLTTGRPFPNGAPAALRYMIARLDVGRVRGLRGEPGGEAEKPAAPAESRPWLRLDTEELWTPL